MRKHVLVLLLVLLAGCSAAPAANTSATSSTQPTWTALTPTSTPISAAHCPQLPAAQASPAAAPPSLYVSRAGAVLAALNLSDGSARWQDTLDPNGLVTAAQVANNVVYAAVSYGTSDGFLVALNASDGHMRWCIGLEPLISNPYSTQWDQLAVDGQTVYIAGSEAGSLRAINASDDSERWHALETGTVAALSAANGRVYVSGTLAPSMPMQVMALDASDGHTIWSVQPKYNPSGLLTLADGVVYSSEIHAQGNTGALDAYNASDGSTRWRVSESPEDGYGQPIVADGMVYLGDILGMVAFSASNGTRRWHSQPLGVEMVGPAADNGAVYLAQVDSNEQPGVTALNGSTGQQAWQMPLLQTAPGAHTSQLRPAVPMTYGKTLFSIAAINGVVVVSYIANTPNGSNDIIATFNAQTGQRGWRISGLLWTVG